MMENFPNIDIFLSFKDEAMYLVENEHRIITKKELKESRGNFGYVREIICDMKSNPIYDFMKESDLKCGPLATVANTSNQKCTLLTTGIFPVKCLDEKQIEKVKEIVKNKGFQLEINSNIQDSSWVIGVESESLYLAASMNKMVTLIPTGFGENLFIEMFPFCNIIKI